MNPVHVELNSYTCEVRFFVDGVQTDPYSALSNFTYEHVLQYPGEILEEISRELNDDFELEVTATEWEYKKFEDAAFDCEDCVSCSKRAPSIDLSSEERAARLGGYLPQKTITVYCESVLPPEKRYGNILLRFTNDPSEADCKILAKEKDIVSAAETILVNASIGEAAKSAAKEDSALAVCYSLSPVVTVSFPKNIQAGEQMRVRISSFPENHPVPQVTVRSSNPDIASVSGNIINALNPGITNIQVFYAGENIPFHSQKIRVEKNIYVSKIEVPALDGILPEGKIIEINPVVFPPDATDAGNLKFVSSDPGIAEFGGNRMRFNSSGTCDIIITGKKAFFRKTITVSARVKEYILSDEEVELNIGQKKEINVRCIPEDCYNGAYEWLSSDTTVAIVICEEGQQFIKATGMGECVLTCVSKDRSVKALCSVSVKSAMYKRKTFADYKKSFSNIFGIAQETASSAKNIANTFAEKVEVAYSGKTQPVDAFADIEISFSGKNGRGTVSITNNSQNPFLRACIYTACPAVELSNGQPILILVGSHNAGKRFPGYSVQQTSLPVTVSGLEEL